MSDSIEIDPEGFERRIGQYGLWLRTNFFSEETAFSREKDLRYFAAWGLDRGLTRPGEVTRPVLERYQRHLFHYRKKSGHPLAISTQGTRLVHLKGFFRWLTRQNHILYNPASDLVLPRLPKRLPRQVLSREEAERVIAGPDVSTPLGLRDRAILETFYSTGMRRMELAGLKLYDIDSDRGTVAIREGKGRRDRMIPIGDRALEWIGRYVEEVRPRWIVPPDEGHVFLSTHGKPLERVTLTQVVGEYVDQSGIGKTGSVHLFRHSMATLMLEGGADIRFIQEMLGHTNLETTQIYTRVSIRALKEIHRATHPAEARRREREGGRKEAEAPEAGPAAAGETPEKGEGS